MINAMEFYLALLLHKYGVDYCNGQGCQVGNSLAPHIERQRLSWRHASCNMLTRRCAGSISLVPRPSPSSAPCALRVIIKCGGGKTEAEASVFPPPHLIITRNAHGAEEGEGLGTRLGSIVEIRRKRSILIWCMRDKYYYTCVVHIHDILHTEYPMVHS